jgi:hypothetical protein
MSDAGDNPEPNFPALMQLDLAKLPIWSGDIKKDGYTCEQWVERVQRAKDTAGWTPQQTMSYVYNALRGKALLWYEALPRYGIDDRNWDVVKVELLDAYSRVQTSRTAVIGLSNLNQGHDETVNDFGARVAKVINDLDKLMPNTARQPQGIAWPAQILALAGFNALAADVKQAPLNAAATNAISNTMTHMGVQLFISNLKPSLRDELMKNPPATLCDAVKAARHLERISMEPKSNGKTVAVQAVDYDATPDVDKQIEALSASFKTWLSSRGRNNGNNNNTNGRARGRGQQRGGRGARGASSATSATCRYCKKPGHLQKYCNARIRAGAPEVDEKGKPYAKYLNEMEGEEEEMQQQQHEQGSISASHFNPWATQNIWEQDFC